ncbi:glycosyltransferase [Neptunitalea lumnitzerae]|uniref:Glycosyltransferase family 4 protein n=1 Tax=Neptunitalea lumnitzerae TaxID=2965509 RepID=A0ABQ5MFE9_9FLAO|nr:glycosyltransferase [Neptunitalea sp. Y10]GLB48136.1 glycosyltransferase family 4 protein [Neptunitalea sp. Y10]
MNIVHIITSLGVGGAEKMLVTVANRQAAKYNVTVIYFKVDDLVEEFTDEVTVIQVPLQKNIVSVLKSRLKEIKPTIVHTHLTHADLFGLLAAKGLKNVRTFTTIHNTKYRHNILDYGYYMLYILLFNVIAPKTRVIAISNQLEILIAKVFKVPAKRIKLLHNTVAETKQESRVVSNEVVPEIFEKQAAKFKILFIGRLSKQKAVHNLLQAIAVLKAEVKEHTIAVIVGDGDLKADLLAESDRLEIADKVFFEGISANTPGYFKNSDIFVLPSIFEGLPLVLLEALKYGLPIIASDIEGPSELIKSGDNGFLFEKNNPDDLAEKIEHLYYNKNLRAQFSAKGIELFNDCFSPDIYIEKLEHIYNEVNGG